MLRRRTWVLACAAAVARPSPAQETGFDHSHATWTALLQRHVVLLRGGQASQLRYAALASDHGPLRSYLAALSGVSAAQFDTFGKARQQAFLINAYNAFTVELVLTRYPALKSIKDLGSFLSSPWKQAWIPLLGRQLSLDGIEHGLLRRRGAYDEPRVHFAVNCASVGCPMLREEAYVAERLDLQLAQQARRFLADRTRNRWNAARGRLELSKIFDWYGEDFRQGHQGIASVAAFAAQHAELLADAPADRERLRGAAPDIRFLDYDWSLNDAR
jgi:hypothetical protein